MAFPDITTRLRFWTWYIKRCKYKTLPTGNWDEAVQDHVVALNGHQEWVVNRKAPTFLPYLQEAFEAHLYLSMFSALNKAEVFPHILCVGHEGDLRYWAQDVTFHIVYDESSWQKEDREQRVTDIQTWLHNMLSTFNQQLNDVRLSAAAKKHCVPKLHIRFYHGCSNPKDAPLVQQLTPFLNNLAWFSYRHTLTGLCLDARLSRVYAKRWTSTALAILLKTSDEHLLELKSLWENQKLNALILNKTKKGLSSYLQLSKDLNLTIAQWLTAMQEFVHSEPADVGKIKLPSDLLDVV